MKQTKNQGWIINNQIKFLIFGLLLTGIGISLLPTILTFRSNLTQIKGTLRAADIYIEEVEDRRGHKSRKAELIFYLNGRQQKFYLVRNIGNDAHDEKYEQILQGLKRSDSVKISVRKSEVDFYEPELFQIGNETETLLEFEAVRTEKAPLAMFILFVGLGSLTTFLWLRFPEKLNKIFGRK